MRVTRQLSFLPVLNRETLAVYNLSEDELVRAANYMAKLYAYALKQ